MNDIETKIKQLSELSDKIKYVNSEFSQKLWGSAPNGDVTLAQMIKFIKDNPGVMEMIIELEKKI